MPTLMQLLNPVYTKYFTVSNNSNKDLIIGQENSYTPIKLVVFNTLCK